MDDNDRSASPTPADTPIHWAAVIESLEEGHLDIFASYLRESGNGLDPSISTYLVKLIRGSKRETGWRLKFERHPNLAPNEIGRERRFGEWKLDLKMAAFIAERDGFSRGKAKQAYYEASKEFGLSEGSIRQRVARYKDVSIRRHRGRQAMKSQF